MWTLFGEVRNEQGTRWVSVKSCGHLAKTLSCNDWPLTCLFHLFLASQTLLAFLVLPVHTFSVPFASFSLLESLTVEMPRCQTLDFFWSGPIFFGVWLWGTVLLRMHLKPIFPAQTSSLDFRLVYSTNCLGRISTWMSSQGPKLNMAKTKYALSTYSPKMNTSLFGIPHLRKWSFQPAIARVTLTHFFLTFFPSTHPHF